MNMSQKLRPKEYNSFYKYYESISILMAFNFGEQALKKL